MEFNAHTYLDLSPTIFFKWSSKEGWPILHVSQNVENILGYSVKDFTEGILSYQEIIHEEDLQKIEAEVHHHLEIGSKSFTHIPYRIKKANGEILWIEDKTYIIRDEKGVFLYMFGYITDITKLKYTEEERHKYLSSLEDTNKELLKTINSLYEYKHLLDETSILSISDIEGNITYVNDAFLKSYGYTQEEAMGKPHNILRHEDVPREVFKEMWETIQQKKIWKGIIKNRRKNGDVLYVDATIAPFLNENREIEKYIGVRHDVTELITKSNQLEEQLFIDPLTNLGNRAKLLCDIEKMEKPILAIFDIIRFNEINDFYGYTLGDTLIKDFGVTLSSLGNEHYFFYRMYADQFAILSDSHTNADFQKDVYYWHNILSNSPLNVEDKEINLGVLCAITTESKDQLLATADITKNYAKMNSLDFCVYRKDIELAKEYEQNIYWQKEIKNALKQETFVPYFQPIFNNQTRKIQKYEALVRMQLKGEIISPFKFLDIAKKTYQYLAISKVMIEKSFAFFSKIDAECSINLTVEDIKNKGLKKFLCDAIKRHTMQNKVILEIVESEGIENFEEVGQFLSEAKANGCKVAIDDFGTGYSNFNYLIKLNVDYIKIDGSIIKNINSPESGAKDVIKAIVTFAKSRGMKTIAEFVSSKEIFDAVCEAEIDFSQGYYIGEPQPLLPTKLDLL